jgi:hypothetical protein
MNAIEKIVHPESFAFGSRTLDNVESCTTKNFVFSSRFQIKDLKCTNKIRKILPRENDINLFISIVNQAFDFYYKEFSEN